MSLLVVAASRPPHDLHGVCKRLARPWRDLRANPEEDAMSDQQALGISVDGIVGPVTWRALVSGMLSF